MTRRLADHSLTGMLVCQQIRGGLELVLGLHRDREMGLVVMAGTGGVLLELIKDVNFCAPPVSRDKARDMLSRMRGAKLLAGLSRRRAASTSKPSSTRSSRSAVSRSTSKTSSSRWTSIRSSRCRAAVSRSMR